ncbi:MAG TPA: LuxR C-terminal-related transcriptional regulator [Acidimicrobiales bacterium]|nr:LuxR C-terminal-related transcriptional regulator [Acidimicrobiales bacterium]
MAHVTQRAGLSAPAELPEWPLTGRDRELRLVRLARASRRYRGVVIAGPPGTGKSCLARAVLTEAEEAGASTATIVATESARPIPLGAFSQFLPPVTGRRSAREPLELLQLVAAEIRRHAAGRPLALIVDDAERLDPVSATLVHQLALGGKAFLVITMRTGEVPADAIASLWKDQLAIRIDLEPLSAEATAELCAAVLGGEVERSTLHRLWEVTRGNPLFLHELVLDGIERGRLTGQEGVWRWRGPFGGAARLGDLVEQRLERIDVDARRAMEVLAFGEPLAADVLEAIAGAETVARLEQHDQIRVSKDGARTILRLAEPLYGEVLRASVPELRSRAIQRSLAREVEATPLGRRDDFLRVAHWRLEGGEAPDPDALLQAAHHAEAGFDFVLAGRLAAAAVEAGGDMAAQRVLASALREQGRPADAEAVWATLQSRAHGEAALVETVSGRSMNLLFGLGSVDEATRVLDHAERSITSVGARHALATQRALIALYAGRPLDGLGIARTVLDAEPEDSPRNAVYAAVTAGPALVALGRTSEAHAVIDAHLPAAFQLITETDGGDGTMLAGPLLAAKFLAYLVAGDVNDAYAMAETTYALAQGAGSHDGIAGLGCALGIAHLAAGRPRRAIHEFRQAAVRLRDVDRNRYLPWCLGGLAHALAVAGEIDAASATLAAADDARTPGLRLFEVELERARAAAAQARGDATEAHRILAATLDEAEATGQSGFLLLALHDIVRLGQVDDLVIARLRIHSRRSEGRFGERALAHAEALFAEDGPALEDVARSFEDAGAVLYAAEIMASAAACHRRAGRPDRAMVAAERARTLLQSCEGARPPAFGLLTADAMPLTRREREIAGLAAEGMTSKVIAENLFLSVRTVDNHLHRAYDKLGVRNRRDLAVLLGAG